MIRNPKLAFALTLGATLALTATARATVYVFTVTCPDSSKIVEQWTTEGDDPGKDFLKAKTEEKHQGCKAADYKAATDGKYLKNTQFYSTKPEGQGGSWIPGADSVTGGMKKAFCGFLNC